MKEKFEKLLYTPATDQNFIGGIQRLKDAQLNAMLERLEELNETESGHKGRIAAVKRELRGRTSTSKEIMAVEKMSDDIQTAETLYGDGMPYEIDRIENQIRFYQDQAGSALLEMGKCLIRIKAHEEHGRFTKALDNVGLSHRGADYAMAAARKFSNSQSIANLGSTKMMALTVLDEEDIQTLANGGDVNGMTLDDIDRMTSRELRDNLRKEREKVKKEKSARQKDREVQEEAIAQKEMKINELDQQLRYLQPPTKEQTALAALQKLNETYTFTLARINGGIREAYNLVREAEKIPGVNALQLSEWLNQFDIEMRAFNAAKEGWLNEVDNASPIEVGKILEEQNVSDLG
jgi:hypothetical protein